MRKERKHGVLLAAVAVVLTGPICPVAAAVDSREPETRRLLSDYVRRFNAGDEECYTNAIPNAAAERFLMANVPRFACPDRTIEEIYYFRWWTYRKHLRHDIGVWTVSEFLPRVPWCGAGNTIVCAAGHHLREGRWLRDPKYMADLARYWLADSRSPHRWAYASWLFTGTKLFTDVSGRDDLAVELLDAAVRYYRKWEKGSVRSLWPEKGRGHMGGDGRGGFLSIPDREGCEYSLGGYGYRPLLASAMWSEAACIAEVARRAGRVDLAADFSAKADLVRRRLEENCWNERLGFFTTGRRDGRKGDVRELIGYAPWYFGIPVSRTADWSQLADPQGFAGRVGLSFPERRAPGFSLELDPKKGCKWNGPSWPYATSIALTAFANDLHRRTATGGADAALMRSYRYLLHQYAAQHRFRRPCTATASERIVPWIDEDLNPDTGEWIARTVLSRRRDWLYERGKDYNHSTFCDLVISGLVGFCPNGANGFSVNPLADPAWDYFVLENLRYRGHDAAIRYRRGRGLSVEVDGRIVARRPDLGVLTVSLVAPGTGTAFPPIP